MLPVLLDPPVAELLQQLHRRVEVVVLAVLVLQERHAHGGEHQPARDEVGGRRALYVPRYQSLHRVEGYGRFVHLTVAEVLDPRALPDVLLADEVVERYGFTRAEGHRAVGRDLRAVDADQHVVFPQRDFVLHQRLHRADQHTFLPRLHLEPLAHRGGLHALPRERQRGEPGVSLVLIVVVDEVFHHGRRDDVPDVLGVVVFQTLERDPDALALGVERGPAAVPRVDRGVDLDPQQVDASVRVVGHLGSGDDSGGDGDGDSADGVADDADRRGEMRERAELHGRDSLEELVLLHGQQGEVAFHADREHPRHVLDVGAAFLELHLRVMLYAVRVCQNPAPGDDEPAGCARHLPLALPREAVVGLGVRAENLNHGVHASFPFQRVQIRVNVDRLAG